MRYNDSNYQLLIGPHRTEDGSREALPRVTTYGSPEAGKYGLVPILDFPSKLIAEADWKAAITDCHKAEVFAMYHQKASGNFDAGWSQKSFGFCWAYGLAAATMDCLALEARPPTRLAPFSLGFDVDWRNRGNSLDSAIKAACARGIASAAFVPEYDLNPKNFTVGWEQDALNYRPSEFYDTDRAQGEKPMISQCLTILATGRALYIAYDWWGHALECVGLRWDEKERNNIVWVLRNSHNEKDVIELAGTKGVPDEAYGVRATSLPAVIV